MAVGCTHLQVVTTARSASWARQLSALQRNVKSMALVKTVVGFVQVMEVSKLNERF